MSYAPPKVPWWVVAKREIMVKLTDKAFWFSTIFVIVMLLGSFGLSYLTGSGGPGGRGGTTVAVADETGARIVNAAARQTGTEMRAQEVPAENLEDVVRDDVVTMALRQTDQGWEILVNGMDTSTSALEQAVTEVVTADNAKRLGVDMNDLTAGTTARVKDVHVSSGEEDRFAFAMMTSIVFAMLFFLSTMIFGLQIAQSVAEEKESRLVEILTSAVSTRDLLIGKVVGNTILALGQLVLWVALALIGLQFTQFKHYLPMLLPGVGWFILFFLVGFAALGCLWAGAGAMASRVQDINNTTTPLIMILMVTYILGFTARGSFAEIMSYVPIASSAVMPRRIVTGDAQWWEALIALGICVVFMMLTIRLGAWIYRRGINQSGGVMKLGDLFSRKAD